MNPRVFKLGGAFLAAGLFARGSDLSIGSYSGPRATLLSIDNQSLPLRQNLCYYLTTPKVRKEPVLTRSQGNPHATDDAATAFYGTVLHDGGKFRMWYYGLGWKKPLPSDAKDIEWTNNLREGPVCYAESPDGTHWTKPPLGQVLWNGSRDNNAISLPSTSTEGVFVIKDMDDPDPARRYKMVYESTPPGSPPTAETAVSADGITWTPAGRAGSSFEPSSFYKFNGLYCVSAQDIAADAASDGGHMMGRQGYVWVSTDFKHWLPQSSEGFLLPEPANPNARGGDRPYTQVHLGVGAASFGNVLVGLYCRWHARPNPGDWFGDGTTWGELGLVVSNDGLHFREPVKGRVFLSRRESPVSEALLRPEVRYSEILIQSGNGILNVGNETRIYHGRWMNAEHDKDYDIEVALATIPRDRWAALAVYPRAQEGSFWTAPITFGSSLAKLTLNADGVQGISIEIADARFHLLPGYSGANAGAVQGPAGLDCPVTWPRGDLSAFAGQTIRFLVHLRKASHVDPRFYAMDVSEN